MNHVKSPNAGYAISYEGTGFDDPNWDATDQPYADAGLTEAEYDALPNYNDVGQPWYVPIPTPTEQADTHHKDLLKHKGLRALLEVLESELPSHSLHALIKSQLEADMALPEYDPTHEYSTGERVTYDGFIWEATETTTGSEPDDIVGDWKVV